MAKAKTSSKITEASLIRKETQACIRLTRATDRIGKIRAMLDAIDDASVDVQRAREARIKFQEGR